MKEISLIANSGIQMIAFPLEIDMQDKFKMSFHEWYDKTDGEWKLELVEQVNFEQGKVYYNKKSLRDKGYKGNIAQDYTYNELIEDGINPIAKEDDESSSALGELFWMSFCDKLNTLDKFINVWLPAPYFFKRRPTSYRFGSLNWSRFKLVPKETKDGIVSYNVILAFDTRAKNSASQYNEYPVFPDKTAAQMKFEFCDDEILLMEYCSPNPNWSYIDKYLMKLVYPDPNIQRVSQIRGTKRKLSYIASYIYLVNYIAKHKLFPIVELYNDQVIPFKDIDMIVDIGNSRTTALLIEDNTSFNQVPKLQLTNFTNTLAEDDSRQVMIRRHSDPFDMRLAFRKVIFGNFGIKNSKQFVYPSFIRLGQEANELIHMATTNQYSLETLSTNSSPKRYLWDCKPTKEEWRFLTLEGENEESILKIDGLSEYLTSEGDVLETGNGGITYNYSRRTLMTFSFLEMLVQARAQINSFDHRTTYGDINKPRQIKRIIITCPTAMSKIERESLIKCAKDAVTLLSKFEETSIDIEIIPNFKSRKDNDLSWYYDEATCAQLVYMYGEVGYKYKGCCSEFFNLYGKKDSLEDKQNSLTIASLDIGAGTSDLMISKYTYTKDNITRITPDPQFYDSFYFAGDNMLESLIKNVMFMSEQSAFRQQMRNISFDEFQQKMKDFVGPDYHGQTIQDRIIRRDFNLQYSVPLMYYFLDLVKNRSNNRIVRYSDVFAECPPNDTILDYFHNKFGFSLCDIEWEFDYNKVCEIISKAFEPLLKKIATIMFANSCDIILLSGRPASLQPIRDILLKYYCVSPNRLILLNNYFIGDWYPYDNNTGYIVDAKPIVAIGAAVAHYAAELSNLNNFIILTDKLQQNLKSTVNYIESTRDGLPISYFISPDKSIGDLTVSNLPTNLNVRQLGIDSYPSRSLYAIDFNYTKIAEKIINKNEEVEIEYSAPMLQSLINDQISSYKQRMPFVVTIERDLDDKEALMITSIIDKNDNELSCDILDLHIQSLGVEEKHWLDTGAFGF